MPPTTCHYFPPSWVIFPQLTRNPTSSSSTSSPSLVVNPYHLFSYYYPTPLTPQQFRLHSFRPIHFLPSSILFHSPLDNELLVNLLSNIQHPLIIPSPHNSSHSIPIHSTYSSSFTYNTSSSFPSPTTLSSIFYRTLITASHTIIPHFRLSLILTLHFPPPHSLFNH